MRAHYLLTLCFIFASLRYQAQKLHPVKDNIACLWGLKDDSGKWVITPEYNLLNNNYGNFFFAMLGEKWGLLNIRGEELIPAVYDNLEPVISHNTDDNKINIIREIVATRGGRTGLIDTTGNVLIPFLYDAISKNNQDNLFYVRRDKKNGIRTYEKELLPCKFGHLQNIFGTRLFIAGNRKDSDYISGTANLGIINISGDTIVPCRFDELLIPNRFTGSDNGLFLSEKRPEKQPLIAGTLNGFTGLYTFEGKCMLEPIYKFSPVTKLVSGKPFSNYYMEQKESYYENSPILFTENGKFGIVTPGKGLIQRAVFDQVLMEVSFKNGPPFYRVKQNGKWGLLNADGLQLLPRNFTQIEFLWGYIFVTNKENEIREYQWHSNKIEPRVYQKILPVHNSLIDLVSNNEFYSTYSDTAIHRCKIRALLPGDISIINPGDAIEGKGTQARRVEITPIYINNSRYFSLETKKGKLLCDQQYNVIINPGAYKSFHELENAQNIVVITQAGKVGMIDTSGKFAVDTIFEAIGTTLIKGLMFVKPWQPDNSAVTGHCIGGWAIADAAGNLLTPPNLITNELSDYEPRQFLRTSEGTGVFDIYERRFITPAKFINGFFTGDGGCIFQTQDSLFLPFSFDGKQLSANGWKRLLHVTGNDDVEHYAANCDVVEGHAVRDSVQQEDAWLLINNDSLAIMNNGKLIRDRRMVLNLLYEFFIKASALDVEYGHSYQFYSGLKTVSGDCPRLKTDEDSGYNPYYAPRIAPNTLMEERISDRNFKDSLVLRMVSRLAPVAMFALYPDNDFKCECFAARYQTGWGETPDDPRQATSSPFSIYYRVMYRSEKVASLRIQDYFHNSDNNYSSWSTFENYEIGETHWNLISLAQLFKPGYEALLLPEITLAIQKADTLDLNCHNPGSYLEQCGGRFSFSEKGLWLYLEDNYPYEFVPLLIPWNRIRSITPKQSPAYTFLRN